MRGIHPRFRSDSHQPPITLLSPNLIRTPQLHSHRDVFERDYFAEQDSIHSFSKQLDIGSLDLQMHMAWLMSFVGSLNQVQLFKHSREYNNYPWPMNPTPAQVAKVGAPAVLAERDAIPINPLNSTTGSPCRLNWSRRIRRLGAPSNAATVLNPLPAIGNEWSTCLDSTNNSPHRSCQRFRLPVAADATTARPRQPARNLTNRTWFSHV